MRLNLYRRAWLSAIVVAVLLSGGTACSGTSGADDTLLDRAPFEVVPEVAETKDVLVLAETAAQEVEAEIAALPDFKAQDTAVPGCAEGQGCFLDKCQSNEECQFGWCVQHLGEAVCTQTCQEECPPGWSCQHVATSGPDIAWICVSDFTNLCRPCKDGNDCKSEVGAEDVCVDYGPQGSFCGGACQLDDDCPWGFSCLTVETVDGIDTTQCVSDAGVCPCTTKSVSLSLWTPCQVENDWGVCSGKRVCSEDGLTECGAPLPADESCNGLDDDCDGDTDEPALLDGNYVNLCDDGNPCTEDLCKGEQGCVNTLLDGGECADGDPCTVADHCKQGVCTGKPVDCDDDNPCTENLCTEDGGCQSLPAYDSCDDFDPCTLGDHCVDGTCWGEAVPCQCLQDSDCQALEDGNLCNGTLACDTSKIPFSCIVDPDSVVVCPPAQGQNGICLSPVCDAGSGLCGFQPANQGALCEDDDACTIGAACKDGDCVGGVAVNCNDGNICTDDSCDPETGCTNWHNSAACNDGDVCTTEDSCQQGECVGTGALPCDDGDACDGLESCNPDVGCVPGTPLSCDDGDVCNGKESCNPQSGCVTGKPPECDDQNQCTTDSCQPESGCVFLPAQGSCEDGNLCTEGDSCQGGLCLPGDKKECGDDDPCTDEYCDPDLGCVTKLNKNPCDDGDLCTTGDHCHLGDCIFVGELTCADGNPCTDDTCHPLLGCQFTGNQDSCNDGNECSAVDVCDNGLCKGTQFLDCADDNQCTADSCDPAQGCVNQPLLGTPCDDGDFCTPNDKCVDGACLSGPAMACNDDNLCTDDECVEGVGCVNTDNTLDCEDGAFCTVGDKCTAGQCQPGTQTPPCNDDNDCTTDQCDDSQDMCTHSPADDYTACAGGAKWCKNGECVDKQNGIFCITGPEKATMSGAQLCQQLFGLPCGPAATKTYVADNCAGSMIDSGRHCWEMPLDPYNAGSAALVCGQ